jgi:hypothetical protein
VLTRPTGAAFGTVALPLGKKPPSGGGKLGGWPRLAKMGVVVGDEGKLEACPTAVSRSRSRCPGHPA